MSGTRQRYTLSSAILGKAKHSAYPSLPSARHSAKDSTRQSLPLPSVGLSAKLNTRQRLTEVTAATHRQALPSGRRQTLGKEFFKFFLIFCLFSLPSALSLALGKDPLCRVPGLALGKEFFFCSQIFSLGFIQCFKVHVKIWLNFVTFYYIFRIIFVLLIYFAKSKFELQVHRIMKSNHSKKNLSIGSTCYITMHPQVS